MTESVSEKKQAYDFDFICSSLGLLRVSGGAINPGAVVQIQTDEADNYIVSLHGSEQVYLDASGLAELEAAIRLRKEEARAAQKQAMREQFQDQQEVMIAVQQGIATPHIINVPGGKRGRQ